MRVAALVAVGMAVLVRMRMLAILVMERKISFMVDRSFIIVVFLIIPRRGGIVKWGSDGKLGKIAG